MRGPNRRHALGAVAGSPGWRHRRAPRPKPKQGRSKTDEPVRLCHEPGHLVQAGAVRAAFRPGQTARLQVHRILDGGPRQCGAKASAWRKLADDNGLAVTQFAPAWPNFADPAKHPELLKTTEAAIADARILGCTQFTVTGHALIDGMSREAQLAGYLAGLMRIAPMLEAAGMTALVEPFNRVNHLNHLLNGSQPALPMVRSVNSPRVKLLWDFYHMQLEDGDLIEKFTAGADQVAHVQIGDVPGRHQPGTGEVNHANLLRAVRAAGYRGKIGLEFMPLDQDDAKAVDEMLALGVA